jgi:hypothetical protein
LKIALRCPMLTPTFSDLGGFLMTFKTMAERRITTTPRVYLWVFLGGFLLVKYEKTWFLLVNMKNMDKYWLNRVKKG